MRELREASPQATFHFTQADQVNQLVGASEADPDRGFMARTMALCSLPRTISGQRLQYKRVNGPYRLYLIVGGGNKFRKTPQDHRVLWMKNSSSDAPGELCRPPRPIPGR